MRGDGKLFNSFFASAMLLSCGQQTCDHMIIFSKYKVEPTMCENRLILRPFQTTSGISSNLGSSCQVSAVLPCIYSILTGFVLRIQHAFKVYIICIHKSIVFLNLTINLFSSQSAIS